MIIEKYGIRLRLVEVEDAEFILSLRVNEKLGRFINSTENDVEKQMEWIREYKKREALKQEFYFITIDEYGKRFGVNRIYDFKDMSFENGSWLFSSSSPIGMSILSELVGRDYGFEELGFYTCRFNVKKLNTTVVNYNLQFCPRIINEDENTIWFELNYDNYKKQRERLLRMFYRNRV